MLSLRQALAQTLAQRSSLISSAVWPVSYTHLDVYKRQVVLLEQLRTIDKKRLKDKVCHLDEDTLLKRDRALEISLELIT